MSKSESNEVISVSQSSENLHSSTSARVVALEPNETNDSEKLASKKFFESDAGDGTAREDQYIHGIQLVFCFLSLFLCMLLVALDQTIITTILPVVGNKFNAFQNVGWLSSAFLLASAVFIQPFGKLSIIVGRKYAMLVGIALFEGGSLMCALAQSMNVLIGGRVLAGVGFAGVQGMSFVILSEILPIEKRPIGMGIMSATFAVASVLGPVIGGLFTTHVTWRWAFYINLPIGGFAAVVFFFTFNPPFPKENLRAKLKTYDYFGTFLQIAGLVVFLLALSFGGNQFKWGSAAVIVCFVLGGLLIIAFLVWNFKFAANPLIPLNLIANREIAACYLLGSGSFAFFISALIYLAVYFQVVQDKSALSSGLHLLPIIIAVVICSILSGILVQKTGHIKELSVFAGVIGPVAGGLLCLLKIDSTLGQQVGLLLLTGISVGAQIQPVVIGAQLVAPKTPGSTILITTLVNFFRTVTSAIAADLADAVYTSSLQTKYYAAINNTTNQHILSQLSGIDSKAISTNNAFIQTLSPDAQVFIKKIIVSSIYNVFYMGIGFASISLIGSILMANKRLPKKVNKDKTKEPEKEKNLIEIEDDPELAPTQEK